MMGPRVGHRWILAVLVIGVSCVACRNKESSPREEGPVARDGVSPTGEPFKYLPLLTARERRETSWARETELAFTAWTPSADGDLSLRLVGPKAPIRVDDPLVLLLDLRNNTDEPIRVFRPLASWYDAWTNVMVNGPHGQVNWSGPWGEPMYGEDNFVTIPPGHILREGTKLPVGDFAGSDEPGLYTVEFRYIVRSHIRVKMRGGGGVRVESEHWAGEICSEPITIEKR